MPVLEVHDSAAPEWNVDQRVRLHDVPWSVYEGLLKAQGESHVPRIAYLDGEVELMTPSTHHEHFKTTIARLLELWSLESGVDLTGYGAWTQKNKRKKSGAEPDECYVIGSPHGEPKRPDLVLEVIWTSGGIDKLEIYRRFAVPEVWFWEDGALRLFALKRGQYVEVKRSVLLPTLDIPLLVEHANNPNQSAAVRAYRDALIKSARRRRGASYRNR